MGEASEMSMSMSVQSAWEDLVVENPNRAKLEGCLLTTIMLVVCCIIALLVYVFVQLQPQGNVGLRPPYWKTTFYDDPPNRQFAIRMMGWINWTATRCKDFSGWACGGRGIEASSLAIGETSETAAEDYAMEYAIELIDRNMRLHKDEPNSGGFQEEEKYDFRGMTSVLKQCRRGMKTAKQFKDSLQAAWSSSWTVRLGMIPVSEGGQVVNMLKSFHDDLHFFPLGDQYYTAKTAGGTESDILTVFPPRFLARTIDIGNPRHRDAVINGFRQMVLHILPPSCCHDDGTAIYKLEVDLMKDLEKFEDDKFYDVGGPDATKLDRKVEDICATVYGKQRCRFLHSGVRKAIGSTLLQKGSLYINWALTKLMVLFSPFLPPDDKELLPIYDLVAMYHGRAEMPHKDILCMHLLEHYYRDTLLYLFSKNDHLKVVTEMMKEAAGKLNGTLSTIGAPGKSAAPSTLLTTQLVYPKSPFPPEMVKKDDIAGFFTAGLETLTFFHPDTATLTDKHAQNAENDAFTLIFERARALTTAMQAGAVSWSGSIFRGEAWHDPLNDRIYVPLGLAVPPYYHNDTNKIKHSVPGFLPKIFKAMLQRFVKYFLSMSKATRRAYEQEPSKKPDSLPSKGVDAISSYVMKQVMCFKKAYGQDRMWDLFYEKSAVQLAYQVWRTAYNHETVNKDTQLRLGYIKFFSEEMLFFVTAANAHCYTANPKFAVKKEQELAPKRVNSLLYSKLLGQSMLCNEQREVFKPPCAGLFPELQRVDEALWTVESWRNAKKVLSN
ncbi:uncharacterized protein [Dermacentor albipictus]|uniref:uncharacterized protein n=1 Tax=Dermacentor albipictus TaxID=60249 RepID=UPI0038FC3615